jgi:hypothetical protein
MAGVSGIASISLLLLFLDFSFSSHPSSLVPTPCNAKRYSRVMSEILEYRGDRAHHPDRVPAELGGPDQGILRAKTTDDLRFA